VRVTASAAERSTVRFDDLHGRIWERPVILIMPSTSTSQQNLGPHTAFHAQAIRIPESAPWEDMEVSSFNVEHNGKSTSLSCLEEHLSVERKREVEREGERGKGDGIEGETNMKSKRGS